MSWKPCRGGRVQLDKYTQEAHEYHFKYQEANTTEEKSKCLFKILRAANYFKDLNRYLEMYKSDIKQLKTETRVYKPLLKYLS